MSLSSLAGPAFAGKSVGLLGGSFNPAHAGHLAISLHALKQLGLDEIWWLVSPQNPLKSAVGMGLLADRMKAATKIARHPRIRVTDIETRLGTRYTVHTLSTLKRRFPKTQFVWLMGADNLQQIPKWRRGLDIFRIMPVAVFRRPTYAAGRRSGKAAQYFDRAWLPVHRAKAVKSMAPPAWIILNNRFNTLSATLIRTNK